jgi:hypothetical protein
MRSSIAAIALLLLAGCNSQSANQQTGGNAQAGGNQQAAPGQTAAAAPAGGSGSLNIQPGLWEIRMEMQAAQVSGMPPGMRMPHIAPTTIRSCVTPEQVSRANANFLSGSGHAGIDCDYRGVTIAGGRIQGTSTCSRSGMRATVVMDGSFTPTSYDVHQEMHSTMGGRSTSSTNHLVGRRIGECTPGQASQTVPGAGNAADGQ